MAEYTRCSALNRAGQPCAAEARRRHPTLGPLCARHTDLQRRREAGVGDRASIVHVRVTPEEHAGLKRAADFRGLSVSELVRDLALGYPLKEPQPVADVLLFSEELVRQGRNLNQVTRALNEALREGLLAGWAKTQAEELLATVQAAEASYRAALLAVAKAGR